MGVTPARRHRHLAVVLATVCAVVGALPGPAHADTPAQAEPTATTPVKPALVKPAPVKPAPVKPAPVKAAPVKAAPVKAAPVKAGPAKTARLTKAQRAVLLDATRRFRDIKQAIAAGYQPTRDCVPGMGYHYSKPSLAGDTSIDPTRPEMLVYAPVADGSVRLAALEYFRADADQNLKTAGDRPTLFGHRFDGPMAGHPLPPGQPPMPVHYDLHVWLYLANPAGELTSENPKVTC
jgi:hypothetical protein